jgi:hypothetical protein
MSKKCTVCGEENKPEALFCQKCSARFKENLESYDAFISYRRDGGSHLATLLKLVLESQFHKNIFLDVDELRVGRFDERLLNIISSSPNFILVLSGRCLERCANENDWLRRELVHAFETGRNIIPVLVDDFTFPDQSEVERWPEAMRPLPNLNGVSYSHIHRDSAVRKIGEYLIAADTAPGVQEEIPQQGGSGKPGFPALFKPKWIALAAAAVLLIVALAMLPKHAPGKVDAKPEAAMSEVRIEIAPWANLVEVRNVSTGAAVAASGTTPLAIQLAPGEYRLKFTHPQLGSMETPVSVAAGTPTVVRRVFEKFDPAEVAKRYE